MAHFFLKKKLIISFTQYCQEGNCYKAYYTATQWFELKHNVENAARLNEPLRSKTIIIRSHFQVENMMRPLPLLPPIRPRLHVATLELSSPSASDFESTRGPLPQTSAIIVPGT